MLRIPKPDTTARHRRKYAAMPHMPETVFHQRKDLPQKCGSLLSMEIISVTEQMIWDRLKPRQPDSNKGTYGKLLILAGSAHYRGAASLAALGALRCGTGIVTIASTERVIASAAAKLYECTYLPLPETPDGSAQFAWEQKDWQNALERAAVCLAGCGMTSCPDTEKWVDSLLRHASCRLILDADALNALQKAPSSLTVAKKTPIITPHVGEMARLTGYSIPEIKQSPAKIARETAEKLHAVTVLKDSVTHIAIPSGPLYRNTTGNAGLAKGGSGDVLAGIISALAAQGLSAEDAAVCGVWLHGKAADCLSEKKGQYAMLPSELPDALCDVFAKNRR